MKLNIAIGKSRHEKRWQNKQVDWSGFLDRIRKTHYTPETIEEYFAFKKDRQDEIKDVGGFVGGHLSGGRRLVSTIASRSLLTFDADEAHVDFWERFIIQYNCAAAIYSTHKHQPSAPRYRLIVPLQREVLPDEYVAIMRRIAGDICIEQFDPTGYQPHRLMYWPSTSKGAEFIFKEQQGAFLNPDEVLASYRNWQDVSEWPRGVRENKELKHDAKKQGHPLEKPGLIGAFNRAYTISEAMENFLPGVYEKTSFPDRYTYVEGSTAAGVIVYDDLFAYSHHSTDPTCNILCNAFDLVRLHKYHLLDTSDEVPVNKRPSYLAMCDLVANDNFVKQQLGESKLENAKKVFADVDEDYQKENSKTGLEEVNLDWLKDMDVDRKGNYLATINNCALILEHDPIFKDNIAFDEFKQQGIFKRNLPWRKLKGKNLISDGDIANIENYIEKVYKLAPGTKLQKGLLVVLEKFSFHPIVKYLQGLKWDGTPRVDSLLHKYLGAADSQYVRTVTRKALVACVARVMLPGIKFDNVLTLVGEEGQGKSQLWDKLGGQWFSDTFNMHMLQSKEAYEQLQGVWIIEIGELAGMAKAEVERVKGFISARMDNYRSPYGRTTEQRLRQCVFFASTNTTDFLKSQTGNRRFWPVATFEVKPSASVYDISSEERNQIWAEAFELYANDEDLYLTKEVLNEAKNVQEMYTEENPLVGQFEDYLNMLIPENWYSLTKWERIDFKNTYEQQDKTTLVRRDRVCKYELWEVVIQAREAITPQGWKMIDNAMLKVPKWQKNKDYMRFGVAYPRHKGAYIRVLTLEDILT